MVLSVLSCRHQGVSGMWRRKWLYETQPKATGRMGRGIHLVVLLSNSVRKPGTPNNQVPELLGFMLIAEVWRVLPGLRSLDRLELPFTNLSLGSSSLPQGDDLIVIL